MEPINSLKFFIDNNQFDNAIDILNTIEENDVSNITDKEISILEKALTPKKASFDKLIASISQDTLNEKESKYLKNMIKKGNLYNGNMVYEFLTNSKLVMTLQKSLNAFDKI
mgnify:CR=1 FL=1